MEFGNFVKAPSYRITNLAGDIASPVDGEFWYNSTTNKYRCRENGVTKDMISSGGGTPGGTNGQLQYNNSGAFGGISGVYTDGATILKTSNSEPVVFNDNMEDRLRILSRFSGTGMIGYPSGSHFDNSIFGGGTSLNGVANNMDISPMMVSKQVTVDRIGAFVTSASAGNNIKVVIYRSDISGVPTTLEHETADLSTSSYGYTYESYSQTFYPNIQYWVGIRHSANAQLRALAVALNIGLVGATATSYGMIMRQSLAFGTAAPSTWTFSTSDLVQNVLPYSVRFRVA